MSCTKLKIADTDFMPDTMNNDVLCMYFLHIGEINPEFNTYVRKLSKRLALVSDDRKLLKHSNFIACETILKKNKTLHMAACRTSRLYAATKAWFVHLMASGMVTSVTGNDSAYDLIFSYVEPFHHVRLALALRNAVDAFATCTEKRKIIIRHILYLLAGADTTCLKTARLTSSNLLELCKEAISMEDVHSKVFIGGCGTLAVLALQADSKLFGFGAVVRCMYLPLAMHSHVHGLEPWERCSIADAAAFLRDIDLKHTAMRLTLSVCNALADQKLFRSEGMPSDIVLARDLDAVHTAHGRPVFRRPVVDRPYLYLTSAVKDGKIKLVRAEPESEDLDPRVFTGRVVSRTGCVLVLPPEAHRSVKKNCAGNGT